VIGAIAGVNEFGQCEQRSENVMLFIRSCVGAFLHGFSPLVFSCRSITTEDTYEDT